MYTWGLLFCFGFFKLFNTFWILTQMDSEKALANTIFYLFVTWQHAIVSWQVFCNFFTRMHQRWVATHLEETNLKQNPVHFGVSIISLRGWWCFLKLLFWQCFKRVSEYWKVILYYSSLWKALYRGGRADCLASGGRLSSHWLLTCHSSEALASQLFGIQAQG